MWIEDALNVFFPERGIKTRKYLTHITIMNGTGIKTKKFLKEFNSIETLEGCGSGQYKFKYRCGQF